MQPKFEKVSAGPGRSFRIQEQRLARFDAPWHFHPEIELTLIVGSRGRRFVGDSIEPFAEGDMVLLGPNLPHFWHNEGAQPRRSRAHSVVVQFRPDFLGAEFLSLPEAGALRRLLARADRGLVFMGRRAEIAAERLRACAAATGFGSLLALLAVLETLTEARARPLASETYSPRLNRSGEQRLARVYAFVTAHFREPLSLARIARVAAMTPPGFSRYFKRVAGRNISEVLNQLRVDCAARELLQSGDRVADIALRAGFPSLSNFNRRFLELHGRTPGSYRQLFREAATEQDALRQAPNTE
jgi:AraC-like DNA-binding protein